MNDISIGLKQQGCSVDIELLYRTPVSLSMQMPAGDTTEYAQYLFRSKPDAVPKTVTISGDKVLGLVDKVGTLRKVVAKVKEIAAAGKFVVDDAITLDSRYLLGQLMGVVGEATDYANVKSGVLSTAEYAVALDSVGVPRLWSKL
jgi:hypothetical protein